MHKRENKEREKCKNSAVYMTERDDYARDNQVLSGEQFHELYNKN